MEDKRNEDVIDFGPVEDTSNDIIKVVGVGGGGCNAVKNMYEEHIANVTFAVCNTDSKALANSPVPTKIMLGDSGLGAGANPEIGKREAEKSKDMVKKLFNDNTKMCFITAGMGGGTGTGAAPVIASIARSMGILTIGIVTIPFFFEKKRKIVKALKGVEEMRKNVDSLLIINNESICDIYSDSKLPIKDALKAADQILCNAAKGISELVTLEGNINLDFRDVEATMRGGGGAIMAIGRARGERRVEKAIINALESPLLYGSDITQAKNILFNIYTSDEAPLFVNEMREIDAFMYGLNPNIDVIWGTSDDNTLGEDAKIIILATGLDNKFMSEEKVSADDDSQYDKIIAKLYREPIAGIRDYGASYQNTSRTSDADAESYVKDDISQDNDIDENEELSSGNVTDSTIDDEEDLSSGKVTDNAIDNVENVASCGVVVDGSIGGESDEETSLGKPFDTRSFEKTSMVSENEEKLTAKDHMSKPSPRPKPFQAFINRLKENLGHLMADDE